MRSAIVEERKPHRPSLWRRILTTNDLATIDLGLPRDRINSREDMCTYLGYVADDDSEVDEASLARNRNRYFKDYFLRRGLVVTQVGRTFFVFGEAIYAWVAANSRQQHEED